MATNYGNSLLMDNRAQKWLEQIENILQLNRKKITHKAFQNMYGFHLPKMHQSQLQIVWLHYAAKEIDIP